VFRFPKPDFSSGYDYPALNLASVEAAFRGWLDIAILIILMGLTACTIYRWRSRLIFLLVSLAGLLWFGIVRKGCPCAVGSVQSIFALLFHPDAVIDLTVLLWFLIPLLAALFFGRLYCGGSCPLGAMQEFLFIKRIPLPKWLWQVLGIVPLFYLGAAAAAAWTKAPNIICLADPFLPVFHPGGIRGMGWLSALFLLASLVIYRPYCRILCPYGLLQSAAAFFSGKRAKITSDRCINCALCEGVCPAGAIAAPDKPVDTESGRRRALPLLLLTAALTAALVIFGYLFGGALSTVHPDVRLAAQFSRGDSASMEAVTFLETSGDIDALRKSAASVSASFSVIMAITGAAAGIFFGLSLASPLFRRRREGRTINQAECFLCSRCIRTCPRERLGRRKEKNEESI